MKLEKRLTLSDPPYMYMDININNYCTFIIATFHSNNPMSMQMGICIILKKYFCQIFGILKFCHKPTHYLGIVNPFPLPTRLAIEANYIFYIYILDLSMYTYITFLKRRIKLYKFQFCMITDFVIVFH